METKNILTAYMDRAKELGQQRVRELAVKRDIVKWSVSAVAGMVVLTVMVFGMGAYYHKSQMNQAAQMVDTIERNAKFQLDISRSAFERKVQELEEIKSTCQAQTVKTKDDGKSFLARVYGFPGKTYTNAKEWVSNVHLFSKK